MHYKTIYELAPLIKSGDLSPVELTRSQLERIEKLDGTLKAYATVTGEQAMQDALPVSYTHLTLPTKA